MVKKTEHLKTEHFFKTFLRKLQNYCDNSVVITALHLCNGFELLNMKCKIEKWLLDFLTGGVLLAM